MAGLVPAIHAARPRKACKVRPSLRAWMAGTSPAMTREGRTEVLTLWFRAAFSFLGPPVQQTRQSREGYSVTSQSGERDIENLIATYAFLVDDGDFDGLGALLDQCDFTLGDGPAIRGKDAIAKFAREALRVYEDGTPRTRHVTTNIIIEVDEEAGAAQSRSYYTVFQAVPGFPLQPIACGRYRDRFVRDGGKWRFAQRSVRTDLVGDVSRHRA
jgi:3-phenylpropionate/cinnamic acid dioxygenase small subunit